MANIYPFEDFHPQFGKEVFLAPNATLTGDIVIGDRSSIWFNAVMRGDVGPIRIGKETNIQDGVIVHCSTGRTPTIIGDRVVIGHGAIIHGCRIEDEVLIGIGAIVLDEAVIPSHTIIAAGALVTERKQLEGGFLYAGIPARKIKPITDEQIDYIRKGAARYIEKASWYQKTV